MRRARRAGCLLGSLAAVFAALAWLGPGPLGWSLRASLQRPETGLAWQHVPEGTPLTAACDLARLLDSPVVGRARSELDALARERGVDLAWFEANLTELVALHDGDRTGYAVGTGLRLSPLLLGRVTGRWQELAIEAPSGARRAVSDGQLFLCPLDPGLVLAGSPARAEAVLALAGAPRAREPGLRLEKDVALLAELVPDERLLALLRSRLDRRLHPTLLALERAEATVTATERLSIELGIEHVGEPPARATESLLRQLDFASRASRSAQGLARLLLGESAALLEDLPPLSIERKGRTVTVLLELDGEQLSSWLGRLRAELRPPT